MTLHDRIGFDAGSRRLEDARVRAVRQTCERHDIHLGLHTSSAVNVAEFSPHVADGVETYLRANVDLAGRLGCEWLVVHAGFHFSSHVAERAAAALARLQRLTAYAEQRGGARLLLENLNREPDRALADNTGEYEIHLPPGQGTIDFGTLFRRLEAGAYRHHYMMAFGTDADKLAARDFFVTCANAPRP